MYYLYVIYGIFISILIIENHSCFARIIRRNSVEYEKLGFTGSDIELSCELTNYYGSDVLWRKVEGVTFIFLNILKICCVNFYF
jgi:hypothetical protein